MTAIVVGPDKKNTTHHLALTDAFGFTVGLIAINTKNEIDEKVIVRNPVERSSLKTSTGQSQYSDLKPPYTALVQQDWSGGRASAKFENDVTKFLDSLRVNTARSGRVILQGRETYGTGFRNDVRSLPGSMKLTAMVDARTHFAVRKVATSSFTAAEVWMWLRYIGVPNDVLTVKLWGDTAGAMNIAGGVLASATITAGTTITEALISELVIATLAHAIVSTTAYWIEFVADGDDDEYNHWEVGCNTSTGSTYQSETGVAWADYAATTGLDIYFRMVPAPAFGDGHYYKYKDQLYFVTEPPDGTASKIYINGTRGVAVSNAGDLTLLIAQGSPGWTNNEWAGCIVVITAGTGLAEAQNYREVVSNNDYQLTCDTDWLIAHTTTTEFVILGSGKWTEITGHGLTVPVTCVKVSSKNVIYFCQGDATNIRRMREYQTGGVWTREYADDGTNKGTFLEEYNENGIMNLLKAKLDGTVAKNVCTKVQYGDITNASKVIDKLTDTGMFVAGMKITGAGIGKGSVIDTIDSTIKVTGTVNSTKTATSVEITFDQGSPAWGTNLKFEDDEAIGESWDRITNLYRYVNDSQDEAVWIMKESGPWVWVGGLDKDSFDSVKLDEFKAVASAKNGKAAAKQNVYLWYSVTNSVHRFYYPNLEDVGPTLGEGLPVGRQGNVVFIFAYPGRTIIGVDAGSTGYSSVLENNGGSNWHEMYRAPLGQRIYDAMFQVIPGSSPDRLWIRQGNDMVYIPFPSDTFDPYQDAEFTYQHEGVLTEASMYVGLVDAWKNWHAVKTHCENLEADVTWIEADYRLDDEETWHTFPDKFEEIPISAVDFGNPFGGSSKKLDLRLRLYSTDMTKTPKLLALIIEAVAVTQPKYAFQFPVLFSTKDMQANVEEMQPHERIAKLDEWSGTASPLLLSSNNPLYDGLKVFLQPLPARPIAMVQGENVDFISSIVIQEA